MENYTSEFFFEDVGIVWGESSDEENKEEQEDETIYDYESLFEPKATDHSRESSFPTYESLGKETKAKEAAIHTEETRKRFQKLMDMELENGDDESTKTVLSVEELSEMDKIDEISSRDSSHPCLKTIEISDSQLRLSNFYNTYPIPEDPGLVPAFWMIYSPPPTYKDDGIQKFVDLVKEMGLRPINSVKKMLQTDTLNLRYYGIDPRIVRVICEALVKNTSIQIVDLTGNLLNVEACFHLNNLLLSNEILSRLDLAGCRIGVEGAEKLHDGIAAAPALIDLDLSRCNIGDDGLRHVANAVSQSQVLENINLKDNQLGDDSAEYLGEMLVQTNSLKHLDISWNNLYSTKFAETFFQGLSENSTVESLNMSGNGLGKDTVSSLSSYLAKSTNLRELDLSGNRFTFNEAKEISKALTKNKSLEILRLGNNPLEPSGVHALISALTVDKSPDLPMKTLDMENLWASKDVLPVLEKIQRERSWLSVNLGGILSNYKLQGPDPKKIFLKRANFEAMSPKMKKLRRNFGHFVLTLEDKAVSRDTFKDSVKNFKLKLTESLVDEIAKAFEINNGQVDLVALKALYLKEYPDTHPPPPQPEKKAKRVVKTNKDKNKTPRS